MQKYSPGSVVKGIVVGIKPYGAFISLDEEYTGLLHISEITDSFVNDVNKYLEVGQELDLKILDVDEETKKVKLSLKTVKNNKGRRKYNLSEEHFNDQKEFRILKEQLPKFMKDTEDMLNEQENN